MIHYPSTHALHTEEGTKDLKHYFAYLAAKTVCRLRIDLTLLRSNPTDPVLLEFKAGTIPQRKFLQTAWTFLGPWYMTTKTKSTEGALSFDF